jgi:zinc transport system substrate-binding protein
VKKYKEVKMNFKNIAILTIIIVIIVSIITLNTQEKPKQSKSKASVIVSTYALYDIAKNIAKDKFSLSTVLPFGSDAHSYELTPKKMAKIQDAQLFVYSGASLEPWVSRFSSKKSLDMSKHVELMHLSKDAHHHHAGHHKHDGHHEHEQETHDEKSIDPHYWLDLQNMVKMSEVLTKEFIKLSPDNKEFFQTNKQIYIDNLTKMQKRYERNFAECKKDTIIVNHNAFSYLGKKYNFHIESISGLSNDSMPSPENIKHILHKIEDKNIKIIFFESFASDKLVKSIAKDTGIKVDTLQPLGNITKDEEGMSYEQIMNENIKKIKQALECR